MCTYLTTDNLRMVLLNWVAKTYMLMSQFGVAIDKQLAHKRFMIQLFPKTIEWSSNRPLLVLWLDGYDMMEYIM